MHPNYRKVAVATAAGQGVRIEEVPCPKGFLSVADLEKYQGEDITALVIQQPNFFGVLEDVDALTDWAHANGMHGHRLGESDVAGAAQAAGRVGRKGADIACGDGQPLGVPLSSGGPYAGFLTTKMENVRQMPGRIVGRTVDLDGKQGFALTLQAREQHIRRGKATSNICTNQGLLVTAATIYLSLVGPEGLARVANECHARNAGTGWRADARQGREARLRRPRFHEAVVLLDRPVAPVIGATRANLSASGSPVARRSTSSRRWP